MPGHHHYDSTGGDVDPSDTLYGYFVDSKVSIAYIVLFSITGLVHVGQSIYHKVWWLTPTFATCALGEVIGWAGREWSSKNAFELNAFLMQICCTIIAPSFLAAGLFFTLGTIISRVGLQYVSLRPKVFSTIFIGCDLISLIVQAVGGATASIAFENNKDPAEGAKIMVGGIIFQIVAITIKITGDNRNKRPEVSSNLKQMLLGMLIATVFLYIRSIYRTIELLDGWTGPIIRNQNLFNYLDALPIVIALLSLNIFNPGRLLFGKYVEKELVGEDGTIGVSGSGNESKEAVV